ncbi:MAG: hypothetical protein II917_04275 [Synergistaceae bacterium]|nr:hypothetical protein [Synergistaceae bacterium]
MEAEYKWYEEIYLNDASQGFMIIIDKKSMKPFATLGWTDYDPDKKRCICGRLMLSDHGYALGLIEGNIILMDYLYRFIDIMYAHVGVNNKKALKWDFSLGFEINDSEWQYPSEALVNNLEQCEIRRTSEKFFETRKKLISKFNINLPEKLLIQLIRMEPESEFRE